MAVPATKLNEFSQELLDLWREVSEFRLHYMIRESERLLSRPLAAHEAAQAHTIIGGARRRLGKQEESLDAHRQAERLEPGSQIYKINIAVALMALGRHAEATDYLRQALEMEGAYLREIFLNLCEALDRLGRAEEAMAAYAEAARLTDGDHPAMLFELAGQAAEIGLVEDAVELFARSLALRRGVKLGDEPALDFIRRSPVHLKSGLSNAEALGRAVAQAEALEAAPIPEEHGVRARIVLTPEGWNNLVDRVGDPPQPTEALRRLLDERR